MSACSSSSSPFAVPAGGGSLVLFLFELPLPLLEIRLLFRPYVKPAATGRIFLGRARWFPPYTSYPQQSRLAKLSRGRRTTTRKDDLRYVVIHLTYARIPDTFIHRTFPWCSAWESRTAYGGALSLFFSAALGQAHTGPRTWLRGARHPV